MSGGISPRQAQNPLSGERSKTLTITHHALSPPPSHHHLYIIYLINCLQHFYRITMSLKRHLCRKVTLSKDLLLLHCIAVRFVRIPVRDGMHRFVCHMNCTADSASPAYESSQYIRCWYICFGLQFDWCGWCVNGIRTVWMSCIHYGPCVDVY